MRAVSLAVAALLPFAAAAFAAPQEQGQAAGSTVRFFVLSGSFVGDVETDAILKETRQGNAVTSAVLDICYGAPTISSLKERFVVELTPAAGKLSGTGRTQVGNEPVSVQLVRTPDGHQFNFEGTIKIGQIENTVSSTDNNDISETEFRDNQPNDEVISATPATFAEPGPGTVTARVKLEALPEFVKALKSENLRVRFETLQPDCLAIRSGATQVTVDIDPMRSATLVAKLKAMPNVLLAGWTGGRFALDYAVRVSSADFGGATFDREKFASAVAASTAKALSATVETTAWDDPTGELTVKLTRPSQSLSRLGLTERIGVGFLPGPERPGSTDALIIWVGSPTIETFDDGPEPRLKSMFNTEGAPGSDNVDVTPVVAALVGDFKGRTWDSDDNKWK